MTLAIVAALYKIYAFLSEIHVLNDSHQILFTQADLVIVVTTMRWGSTTLERGYTWIKKNTNVLLRVHFSSRCACAMYRFLKNMFICFVITKKTDRSSKHMK